LKQESNNSKNKNNIFFEDKFDKEATKKKTKIKKVAKNKIKNNKRKNCILKKKHIKKIKKKIVLVKLDILISFEENILTSTFLVLKTNRIIAILINSYINIRKNLLCIQLLIKISIIVNCLRKKQRMQKNYRMQLRISQTY